MLSTPSTPEIDERTLKLVVGVIAISLAGLTSALTEFRITSISAAYYEGRGSQIILVGFLFAIAAFLLAYNGKRKREMVLSKVASLAALGVAMAPCHCPGHPESPVFVPEIPYVHSASAVVMFSILAFFCYEFYLRAQAKGYVHAERRARIYAVCGILIVVAMVVMGIDELSGGTLSARFANLTFVGEAVALIAFGVSWLTASKILPGLANKGERLTLT